MLVNPSDPIATTDFCRRCTVVAISDDDVFLPNFDCSNRLIGDCVGFDEDTGICIDNTNTNTQQPSAPAVVSAPTTPPQQVQFPVGGTAPVPRQSPTTSVPVIVVAQPTATAPRIPPTTPFPVVTPTTTVSPPRIPPTNTFPVVVPTTLAPRIAPTSFPTFSPLPFYIDCQDSVGDDGNEYSNCILDVASPFQVQLNNSVWVTFGTESYVTVSCQSDIPRSNNTCKCEVIVNPSDPLTATNICNSCTVKEIDEEYFLAYFDCSNRLVGYCVGFETDTGYCIDNRNDPPPTPPPFRVTQPSDSAPQPPVNSPIAGPSVVVLPTRIPRASSPSTAIGKTPTTSSFDGEAKEVTNSGTKQSRYSGAMIGTTTVATVLAFIVLSM